MVSTESPENIIFSPGQICLGDLEIRGSEIGIATKYPLAEIPIRIHLRFQNAGPGENEQVELGTWARHFSNSKRIEFKYYYRRFLHGRTFLVTGFENYPQLESLRMGGEDPAAGNVTGTTTNLNGIEFCTNLRELDVKYHQITDLTPIKDLPIRRLNISHNPIQSFDPINFGALEELIIDRTQIDLFSDGHDLTSLKVLSIDDSDATVFQHPGLVSLARHYGLIASGVDHRGIANMVKEQ